MRGIWRLSSTGVFQILVSTTSWVFLVRILSAFGSAVRGRQHHRHPPHHLRPVAGVGAGQRRGDDGRARRSAPASPSAPSKPRGSRRRYNFLCLAAVERRVHRRARGRSSVSSPAIRRWRRHAVACLRTVSLGFMAYGFGMTLASALNGAGDTWTPTWINIGCFWCFEIPLAYVLAIPLGLGPAGRLHRRSPSASSTARRRQVQSCSGGVRGRGAVSPI